MRRGPKGPIDDLWIATEKPKVKTSLVTGAGKVEHAAVDESNTISFLGDGLRVYSTPAMVNDVEYACFRLIGEHLDPGETSLGVHVSVDHLGATPFGHRVEIAVVVRSVEGRKVTLDAEVRDAAELVGRGTHVRMVTEVERLRPKIERKRERLDAAGARRSPRDLVGVVPQRKSLIPPHPARGDRSPRDRG